MRDLRNVCVGLLLGVCVTAALGRAPAPRPAPAPMPLYQFTAEVAPTGDCHLVILDHRTQKLYRRSIDFEAFKWDGMAVEELLGDRKAE
jgi:hypothetical protein